MFVAFSVVLGAQSRLSVGYDEFMSMSEQDRIRTFNNVSPSNRAALVREQVVRWASQNGPRLTAEQRDVLDEVLRVVKAETYDTSHPERAKFETELKLLESRVKASFSVEDAVQAFTIHGRHIPR